MKIEKGYWWVITAGLISGTVVFGGQIFANLGLSLYQLSTLPFILGLIVILPLAIRTNQLKIKNGMFLFLILFGLVDALLVICQFGAVYLGASVVITVLLLYTQPIWTVLFSRIFLKEKLTKRKLLACLIVLVGALILINPFQGNIGSIKGIIVAIIGGILLSGWVVMGSIASKRKNDPINTLFVTRFFMLFFLFVLFFLISIMVNDRSFTHFSLNLHWTIWIYLLIFGILAEVINNLAYLKGVQTVPTVDAGIIMLLEPVAGALLAAIFLHQPITLNIILGGILILTANYLVIIGSKNEPIY